MTYLNYNAEMADFLESQEQEFLDMDFYYEKWLKAQKLTTNRISKLENTINDISLSMHRLQNDVSRIDYDLQQVKRYL